MKKTNIKIITAFTLASFLSLNIFSGVEARPASDIIRYENKADFVCGFSDNQSEMKSNHNILVDIYNPNDFPVMVNSYLSLSPEGNFLKPDLNNRYLNVLLSPNRGFLISCEFFENLFFEEMIEDQKGQINFKGFIQSKSIKYLDVAYHYTSDSIFKTSSKEEEQNEANKTYGVKFITFYSNFI